MSTKRLKHLIAAIEPADEAPYLILGRKVGVHLTAGTYPISEDMQDQLRSIAQDALDRIDDFEMSDYGGPTSLERGTEGLYVEPAHLNADSELLDLLSLPDDLPTITSQELHDKSISFYAIGVGSSAEDRAFFVRKQVRTLKSSNLIVSFWAKELNPLDDDIIYFDRATDFILTSEGAVVFDMRAFEQYVQDPEDIAEELTSDLSEINDVLPFADDTFESLKKKAGKGVLLRRKIRSIVSSEYFSSLDMKSVRDAFKSLGRDPKRYIKGSKLNFELDDAAFVLKVLDQSAWPGSFDGKVYSTNAKRAEI